MQSRLIHHAQSQLMHIPFCSGLMVISVWFSPCRSSLIQVICIQLVQYSDTEGICNRCPLHRKAVKEQTDRLVISYTADLGKTSTQFDVQLCYLTRSNLLNRIMDVPVKVIVFSDCLFAQLRSLPQDDSSITHLCCDRWALLQVFLKILLCLNSLGYL